MGSLVFLSASFGKDVKNGSAAEGAAAGRGGAPCAGEKQRWEAVFRRERKPVSFDRPFLCGKNVSAYLKSEKRALFCRFSVVFQRRKNMKKINLQKWTVAGLFCAAAVVGSLFSFPVFSSKCAPVQHMVNVLCAVLLGPGYAVAVAFVASLLRNLLGLGTLMAFPGSMFGALLCGIAYRKTENLPLTFLGEVFGTSVIGGLAAYPVAVLLMGKPAGSIAFYGFVVPFLISTVGGTILAAVLILSLQKTGTLGSMKTRLEAHY